KKEVEVYVKSAVPVGGEEVPRFGRETPSTPVAIFRFGSVEQFNDDLNRAQEGIADSERVRVIYESSTSFLDSIFSSFLLPLIFLVAMWFLIMRKMSGAAGGGGGTGGIFNIGKSKAQLFEKGTRVTITF